MSKPLLKLREVIWEVNARCNKNCTYCGSKGIIGSENELTIEKLKCIAAQLNGYHVDEVTLSGGEPGLLSPEKLKAILDELTRGDGEFGGCKVKAVTNGKLFEHDKKLLKRFHRIGLSLNLASEIPAALKILNANMAGVTIITNFGKHNWFDFEQLEEFYRGRRFLSSDMQWQIQLTMGKDFLLPPSGIKELRKKIDDAGGAVMADNLQVEHDCTAGIYSCGITWQGGVIACLAERSYCNNLDYEGFIVGNGSETLKEVWETGFRRVRFGDGHKSCRDCIKYPKDGRTVIIPPPPAEPTVAQRPQSTDTYLYGVSDKPMKPKLPPSSPIVQMYAVFGRDDRILYGVQ